MLNDNLFQTSNGRFALIVLSSATLITFTTIAWFTSKNLLYKRKRTREFVESGRVDELYLYPIKSCKPNKVDWIDCNKRGGSNGEEFDRHFLLVDSLQDNLFLTARIYPKMVLVEAHVIKGKLIVKFPSGKNDKIVEVDLKQVRAKGEIRRARLFSNARTEGFDCGDEIGKAFDEFLEVGDKRALRLIWFGDAEILYTERDEKSKSEFWLNNDVPELQENIAFHDLASFMAFSSESVNDLNKHLKKEGDCIDSRNFRPTLVISGLPPYDEDSWLRVKAGDAEFICYKPCTRCVLTTVNPDSGEKSPKMEPIRMLRKYRLAPGKLYDLYKESPVFGVNMTIVKPGRVCIGDPVWIQYKPKPF